MVVTCGWPRSAGKTWTVGGAPLIWTAKINHPNCNPSRHTISLGHRAGTSIIQSSIQLSGFWETALEQLFSNAKCQVICISKTQRGRTNGIEKLTTCCLVRSFIGNHLLCSMQQLVRLSRDFGSCKCGFSFTDFLKSDSPSPNLDLPIHHQSISSIFARVDGW